MAESPSLPMEASQSGGPLVSDGDNAGVDRLSALPIDVQIRILIRLDDAAAAARTSVLSSCWRRLWLLLPELRFPLGSEPRLVAAALAAHNAALSYLSVGTLDADGESVAAWLPAVARRLTGDLSFTNHGGRGGDEERGSFELPCLANATRVTLDLGHGLGLAVAPAGVFARLTVISLTGVLFRGACALGDAVSSPRCPCLEELTVRDALGLDNLTIRSDSLLEMTLDNVRGLEQLAVAAPALVYLSVLRCFMSDWNPPVADIAAPALKVLRWGDLFDASSVHLGTMEHLETVCPMLLFVYGSPAIPLNQQCLKLLRCFKTIQSLCLTLSYPPNIDGKEYLMEDMTMLPHIMTLHVRVTANGHAFGASLFHVLRLCSGTRKLTLHISNSYIKFQKQTSCPPGCICDERQDWKFKELLLNHLREVEITNLRGSEHEVIFVKHLLGWATELKKMTIFFNSSVTENMAEKSFQILRRFSRQETCMEFYMDKDTVMVPYAPKD